MPTSHSKIGYGAALSWNSQAVARISKIGEFGFSIAKNDITTFSAAAVFKEYGAGMIDPGELSLEGFLATNDTNGQVAMLTDAKARTSRTVVITLPTTLGTVTFTGTAFITDIKIGDITPEGTIPIKIKLAYTGETTLAIA